jgi:hypothetical protein
MIESFWNVKPAPEGLGFSSPKPNIFPRPISGGQVTSPTLTYVESVLYAV